MSIPHRLTFARWWHNRYSLLAPSNVSTSQAQQSPLRNQILTSSRQSPTLLASGCKPAITTATRSPRAHSYFINGGGPPVLPGPCIASKANRHQTPQPSNYAARHSDLVSIWPRDQMFRDPRNSKPLLVGLPPCQKGLKCSLKAPRGDRI